MIINIRGTSGSGKSHLVRHIMSFYDDKEPVHIEGRKQPFYYVCRSEGHPELAVLGHYETACGGCDTINGLDIIFNLAREQSDKGRHVLFEGLLLANDVERTKLLPDIRVITLSRVPLETCIESINSRRRARGVMEPVATKNTESKYKQIQRVYIRLKDHGIPVWRCDREEAAQLIEEMLGLS